MLFRFSPPPMKVAVTKDISIYFCTQGTGTYMTEAQGTEGSTSKYVSYRTQKCRVSWEIIHSRGGKMLVRSRSTIISDRRSAGDVSGNVI